MRSIRTKFTESMVPRSLQVKVIHLHEGNSSEEKRGGARYVTHAHLVERKTGEIVARAEARCSPNDCPVRSLGRRIAVGRALKNFFLGV